MRLDPINSMSNLPIAASSGLGIARPTVAKTFNWTINRTATKWRFPAQCFELVLGDGSKLKSSDFKLNGTPQVEKLAPQPDASTAAKHFPGQQVVANFSAPSKNLSAEWRVVLRDGSHYVREELTLRADGKDVLVKEIVLFDAKLPGAKTVGSVDGSPVVANNFFVGYEHPMAKNSVDEIGKVQCGFERNAVLKDGESLVQSCVIGAAPPGQLRRGFLEYVERERAHPYRPFLNYNSWYDIHKYSEAQCVKVINEIGEELVEKRHAAIACFLFDDGWDDTHTLWKFSDKLPNGFTPLAQAAAKYGAHIGVWISPFGGYGNVKKQRLDFGSAQGFETTPAGFSLSGPKYYERFHDICVEMLEKYGVNQFKFDGLAAGAQVAADNLTRDGDAMLKLIAELRAIRPELYINQTVGTWPSPFWLLYVDSTWRGESDHSFYGKGSVRQQWITYRDMITYKNVVKRAPLYPLNSIMLHGVIYGKLAKKLETADDADFADEVHNFFGSGTQVQELYLTPSLLNEKNWDDLAEAAKWSAANADVLVDTHWIGGDPAKAEVYGWASWSPHKGILCLRNPDEKPAKFEADVAKLFELPADAANSFELRSPWKSDREKAAITARAGEPIELAPFEVLVLESKETK